jgi:gas vesicle protein
MRNSEWDLSAPYWGMIAFFIGGAVAATVALVCAVQEGRQRRERIRSVVEGAWRRTSDAANELAQQGRELVTETVAPLSAAYTAGREAFWREYSRNRE